jgi:hypothetical protein
MKPKILFWNVQGLNKRDKMWRIRNLLREWTIDIVCLQETKLQLVSRVVVYSLSAYQHVNQRYLSLRGASRGILLMWDRGGCWGKWKSVCVWGGGGGISVACSFRNVDDNFECAFASVDNDRRVLYWLG